MGQSDCLHVVDCAALERWRVNSRNDESVVTFSKRLGISKSTYYTLKNQQYAFVVPHVHARLMSKNPPSDVILPSAVALSMLFDAAARLQDEYPKTPLSEWPARPH